MFDDMDLDVDEMRGVVKDIRASLSRAQAEAKKAKARAEAANAEAANAEAFARAIQIEAIQAIACLARMIAEDVRDSQA